ncbi:MAG: hypothetical protein ACFB10_18695 [Salibacteraceae bacterium]
MKEIINPEKFSWPYVYLANNVNNGGNGYWMAAMVPTEFPGADLNVPFQTNGSETRLAEVEIKNVSGADLLTLKKRVFIDDPNNDTGIEGHFFNPVSATQGKPDEKGAKIVVEWKDGNDKKLSLRKYSYGALFGKEPEGQAITTPSQLNFIPLTYLKNLDDEGKFELYVIVYGFSSDACFGLTNQVNVDVSVDGFCRIIANIDTTKSDDLIVYKFELVEIEEKTVIEFILNHSGGEKSKGAVSVEDADPKPTKSLK